MIFFGALGYVMKKLYFPVALMGYILGYLLETSLVQALILSSGSIVPFFARPISLLFVLLTVFFVVWSLFIQRKKIGGAPPGRHRATAHRSGKKCEW